MHDGGDCQSRKVGPPNSKGDNDVRGARQVTDIEGLACKPAMLCGRANYFATDVLVINRRKLTPQTPRKPPLISCGSADVAA